MKNKKYTKEFKLEAERLLTNKDTTATDLSRELGVKRKYCIDGKKNMTLKGLMHFLAAEEGQSMKMM